MSLRLLKNVQNAAFNRRVTKAALLLSTAIVGAQLLGTAPASAACGFVTNLGTLTLTDTCSGLGNPTYNPGNADAWTQWNFNVDPVTSVSGNNGVILSGTNIVNFDMNMAASSSIAGTTGDGFNFVLNNFSTAEMTIGGQINGADNAMDLTFSGGTVTVTIGQTALIGSLTGNAVTATMNGDGSLTILSDGNISGGRNGIGVTHIAEGSVNITANGDTTGIGRTGIGVTASGGADVNITTGDGLIWGKGRDGIAVTSNYDTGKGAGVGGNVTIKTGSGDVIGTGRHGILVNQTGGSVTITTGTGQVLGYGEGLGDQREPLPGNGITVVGSGGPVSITTGTGLVRGFEGQGIYVGASGGGASDFDSVTVVTGGEVRGSENGIRINNVNGPVNVTTNGLTVGETVAGIKIDSNGSNANVVTNGEVKGATNGIFVFSTGGNIFIDANAAVTGGTAAGIFADSTAAKGTVGSITIDASASVIGTNGITARSSSGYIKITTGSGEITGTKGDGVYAESFGSGEVTVTTGSGQVNGTDDGIDARSGSGNVTVNVNGKVVANDVGASAITFGSGNATINVSSTGNIDPLVGSYAQTKNGAATINNSGVIDGDQYGARARGGIDGFFNTASGSATINNDFGGVITSAAGGTAASAETFSGQASIYNDYGASIQASASGTAASASSFAGYAFINNDGSITAVNGTAASASSTLGNAQIDNGYWDGWTTSGTISSQTGNAAVASSTAGTATINNYYGGSITAGGSGNAATATTSLLVGGNAYIYNDGSISAQAGVGANVFSGGAAGSIYNDYYATISSNSGVAASVIAATTGDIYNYGSIQTTSGIAAASVVSGGAGSIYNYYNGQITAGANGVAASIISGGNAYVYNDGSITGGVGVSAISGANASVYNDYYSTITGLTGLLAANDATVTNYGWMRPYSGSYGDVVIDAAAGNNTNVYNYGTLDGRVNLAADNYVYMSNDGYWNTTGVSTFAADSGKTIDNYGWIYTSGTTEFNFSGDGSNVVNNYEYIYIDGSLALNGGSGLQFNNSGYVDMINGSVNNAFFVSGQYNGNSGGLGIDAQLGGPGSVADVMTVGGATTGLTYVVVNDVGGPAAYNPTGIEFVRSQNGQTLLGQFVLDSDSDHYDPVRHVLDKGLFFYDIATRGNGDGSRSQVLIGVPDREIFELPRVISGAQTIWYESAGVWLDRQADLRRQLMSPVAVQAAPVVRKGYDDAAPAPVPALIAMGSGAITPGVWAKAIGSWTNRDGSASVSVLDRSYKYNLDYNQNVFGLLGGVDFGTRGMSNQNDALVFGALAGYLTSDLDFKGSSSNAYQGSNNSFQYKGATVGLYGTYINGGFYADLLAKADLLDVKYKAPSLSGYVDGLSQGRDANSYGARLDMGYRYAFSPTWFVEPTATLAYVKTDIDSIAIPGGNVGFDGQSLRGALGVRLGTAFQASATTLLEASITGRVWNEFDGDNKATIVNSGPTFYAYDKFDGAFGEVVGLLNIFNAGSGWSGFANVGVKFNNDFTTTTAKAGIRYVFGSAPPPPAPAPAVVSVRY